MHLQSKLNRLFFWIFFIFLSTFGQINAKSFLQNFNVEQISSDDTRTTYKLQALNISGGADDLMQGKKIILVNGEKVGINFKKGIAQFTIPTPSHIFIEHSEGNGQPPVYKFYRNNESKLTKIPLWVSIIPPFIAILLALLLKEVFVSLFVGIWAGAFVLNGFSFKNIFSSLFSVVDTYIVNALADSDHLAVIIFSLLIGGMVAIISRNGGMAGVVDKLAVYANSARNSQLVTWFLGVAIFFDDYANTLIVGNTMRPVTDKFKVSREKLAYIVDSTAAPIAAVAFVTTWIGAELGYIEDAVSTLGIQESAYSLFINSLAYSFYPIFTLVFILMLILMNKDYGAMYKAEVRARTTGDVYEKSLDRGGEVDNSLEDLSPVKGAKHYWWNALIPVLCVVIGTMVGLVYTGYDGTDTSLSYIIGNSNSYAALLWSSSLGVIAAVILTLTSRIMSLRGTMETLVDGIKTMLPAIIILILAWSLGQITKDLHTAAFLSDALIGNISPSFFPLLTFVLAGLIAFSTGSSWSTMAILYPLILPTTWAVAQAAGWESSETMPIFYNVISCVLAGSVLGDHCSPISDTTILSSLASSCNHLDHVKTQLPYALTVGAVSLVMGTFSALAGLPFIINFLIGFVVLFGVVRFLGKGVEVD